MGKKYDFDYIIIGSGPAGSAAALELGKAKKKVAIVESNFFGGSNLNTRDVPSLVSLDFAHTYARALNFPELKNQELHLNLPTIPAHQFQTIIECGGNSKKVFESAGVTCIKGTANFLDAHTVAVAEKRFTAETFIIATGAKLNTEGIANVDFVKHLTPETALKITRFPKVVAIVGGGSTGVELAEYYAELGIKVIIFESANYLLPREDREVSDTISDYLTQQLGVTVLPSCKVLALEEDDFSKRIVFKFMNTEKVVRVDCIVLATGSTPNLVYGLENAKVKYTENGIAVNKIFQTSAKNIYAVGDCLGRESSTDRAWHEGTCVAVNLINKTKNSFSYRGFVRSVKTYPEIATVGYTENDLLARGRKYRKAVVKLSDTPVSKIYHFDYGLVKLLADHKNHLLGATVVAPHAELIVSELAVAVRHNLSVLQLASTPHNMNSYNYIIKLAAKELSSKHQTAAQKKAAKDSRPIVVKAKRSKPKKS